MNRRLSATQKITLLLSGALMLSANSVTAAVTANPWPQGHSPGLSTLAESAEQGRYAFVLF